MHLLYLDHSGEITDPYQHHFTLAGLSIFERQTHWLSEQIDKVAARFNPADPRSVELHASPMITGNLGWKAFPQDDRKRAVKDVLSIIAASHPSNTLFGVCKDKRAAKSNDLVSEAFEDLCVKFDKYLGRLHKLGDTQRGVIIFDKASYENQIQGLTTDFQTTGHAEGITRNLSEVPLFLDSRASRLIQAADIIAWAINRKYEKGESEYFDIIKDKFYKVLSKTHGFEYFPFVPS